MTRQYQNQTFDQKKGSADDRTSGQPQGMPGGEIGRNQTRNAGGNADEGGPEGNSRERKTARNGSDSNES
jgi:hypothetical protein